MESANNQYILKWKEHVLKAAEALRNKDYETYESEMEEMESTVEEMKRDEQLSYNGETSFGVANEMFESALPTLFINNKNAVKDVIQTIREDKNLIAQFMFFESLKQYKKDYDLQKYLDEAVALALSHMDVKSVKESNQKFYNMLRKHNIKASMPLNENNINFYNYCDIIFTHSKSLSNIGKLNETFNKIAKHVKDNAININEEKYTLQTVKEFVDNCNRNLTESEKEFVNILISNTNENNKKEFFESQKLSCIENIESLINESTDNATNNRLNNLLESIQNKTYNKETVLQDIIKIMEINEVLNN